MFQDKCEQGKVVVIGAGLTGLSAAHRLVQLGEKDVVVLEADEAVGGLAGGCEAFGHTFDYGSHRLHIHSERDAIALAQNVLGEDLLRRVRRGKLRLKGRFIRYPPSLYDLTRSLGIGGSIKCLASFILAGIQRTNPPRAEDECYEEDLRRLVGDALYQAFYSPYALKVFGIHPSMVSTDAIKRRTTVTRPKEIIKDILRRSFFLSPKSEDYFYYPRQGCRSIGDALARKIREGGGRIYCGVQVKNVQWRGNRVLALLAESSGKPIRIVADAVISTMPVGDLVCGLDPLPDSRTATAASNLNWRAMKLIYLITKQPLREGSETFYFPESRYPFGRISVPGRFSRDMSSSQETTFCVEVICNYADAVWNAECDQLSRICIRELERLGLLRARDVVQTMSVGLRQVYPVYHSGWSAQLQVAQDVLDRLHNLISVGRGGLFLHSNIDHSIVMGQEAAEQILSSEEGRGWQERSARFRTFRVRD